MIKIKYRPRLSRPGGAAIWSIVFFLMVLGTASGAVLSEPHKQNAGQTATPSILGRIDDFESHDGGWTPSGPTSNWEYGTIVPQVFENCGFTAWPFPEPSGAHSGSKVWATKLNGCYENFNGASALTKTYYLPAQSLNLELRWWQWLHVFVPYDQARVLVNDQEVWRAADNIPTSQWTQQKVSLAPFSGQTTLTVQFVLEATSEVNRMGWYLDDIEINLFSIYLPLIFNN